MFRTSLHAQSCGSVYLLLCFLAEEIIFPQIIFGDHASLFLHSPSLSFVCCRCSRRNQSQSVDRYLYPESRLAMFAVGFRVSLLAIRGRRMLFAPSILPGDLCLCWVSVLQSEDGENIYVFRSRFWRQDFFDTMNAQKLHLDAVMSRIRIHSHIRSKSEQRQGPLCARRRAVLSSLWIGGTTTADGAAEAACPGSARSCRARGSAGPPPRQEPAAEAGGQHSPLATRTRVSCARCDTRFCRRRGRRPLSRLCARLLCARLLCARRRSSWISARQPMMGFPGSK